MQNTHTHFHFISDSKWLYSAHWIQAIQTVSIENRCHIMHNQLNYHASASVRRCIRQDILLESLISVHAIHIYFVSSLYWLLCKESNLFYILFFFSQKANKWRPWLEQRISFVYFLKYVLNARRVIWFEHWSRTLFDLTKLRTQQTTHTHKINIYIEIYIHKSNPKIFPGIYRAKIERILQ